jgi:hypothetical protein
MDFVAKAGADARRAEGLTVRERLGLAAFALVLVAFVVPVEFRSAFLTHRKGDLNVFLRAAWAVRSGADLYAVTDDNGFHYCYPPLLAILLTPLADPPAGADRSGTLPYPVSVATCYALNLVCLALGVHTLARALEGPAGPPAGSRSWWALRVGPVLVCVVPIGHTLMRGQVNLLLLALLCASAAAVIRGRSFRGGAWLAAAIAVKIIPAFLLVFPVWRRDLRFLAGAAAGLAAGLVVVPVAALGPQRTADCYRKLAAGVISPGLGVGGNDSLADELTDVKSTDSQSILAVLHNNFYPDFDKRPAKASATVRLAAYLVCGVLTVLTLAAAGRRGADDSNAVVLFWGLLTVVMLLTSPVCHQHYFALWAPLAMALLADRGKRADSAGAGLLTLFAFAALASLLPVLPGLERLRDGGAAAAGALALWAAGVATLWRRSRRVGPPAKTAIPRAVAA